MDKVFWAYFHSVMSIMLFFIWTITQIVRSGKDFTKSLKKSENKSKTSVGETIVYAFILCVVLLEILWWLLTVVLKNPIVATWFIGIFGIIYVYIAIKQMIKIIFIPENRAFSDSDIEGFVYTYMVWCLMVNTVNLSQPVVDMLTKMLSRHSDIVKVGMVFLWFYFNLLFALGGMYILLYYLWVIGNRLVPRFSFIGEKIKKIIDRIREAWHQGEKYTGLRIFALWRENKKRIIFKIFMTIPFLLFDILVVMYLLVKIFIKMIFTVSILSIFEPIRMLYTYIKKLWNRHKNNEWMYVLAQIAGLCSYIIVFLIIQYGEYEEATKNVYEFAGTIILIPYFLGKIMSLKNKFKEEEVEISGEEEKKNV